jgi:exopolysaccharide biosynthesis predicted pyruvyltransferase EpsI
MQTSEQLLRDVGALLTYHHGTYVANPGNLGDALITAGLESGLGRAWSRQVPASRYLGKERTVVYSGGGNLVGLYDDCQRTIERFMMHEGGTFVLLPHTVRNCDSLISRLDSRFTFYLRDVPSYEYVTQLNPRVTCYLAHDLALLLNRAHAAQLMRLVPLRLAGSLIRPRSRFRHFARAIHAFYRRAPRSAEARLFRSDAEARHTIWKRRDLAPSAFDISALYVSAYRTCHESLLAAGMLLRFLDRYEVIHTDRLHVSIAAAILGKRVLLHDNSYGKNRDVFHMSLTNRPDFNIEFCG